MSLVREGVLKGRFTTDLMGRGSGLNTAFANYSGVGVVTTDFCNYITY